MINKRVLALSSSRVGNESFLQTARQAIHSFLGNEPLQIAFVPFASTTSYVEYAEMVKAGLKGLPYKVEPVLPDNAQQIINESHVIMIGGGNTFKLLHHIYSYSIYQLIIDKVNNGTPYIGWSAGANLTGLSIGTTNDMPIIEPESFKAFGLLPFQLNPHYINQVAEGFNGETRDQRLTEFVEVNPNKKVVGLPEGSFLLLEENRLTYQGPEQAVLFASKEAALQKEQIEPGQDVSYLL